MERKYYVISIMHILHELAHIPIPGFIWGASHRPDELNEVGLHCFDKPKTREEQIAFFPVAPSFSVLDLTGCSDLSLWLARPRPLQWLHVIQIEPLAGSVISISTTKQEIYNCIFWLHGCLPPRQFKFFVSSVLLSDSALLSPLQ